MAGKAKANVSAKSAGKAKSAAKEVKAKPMTKGQIVNHLADKFKLLKKTAGEIVEEMAELAVLQTKDVGEFVFPGLGKLVKARSKARTGVNPKTREKMTIPAKTVVKFRVAKAAKDSISSGK